MEVPYDNKFKYSDNGNVGVSYVSSAHSISSFYMYNHDKC